jgi:hypothetical protein
MSLRLHGFADFANYQLPEIGSYICGGDSTLSDSTLNDVLAVGVQQL